MRIVSAFLLSGLCWFSSAVAAPANSSVELPSFPGAEGFGAATPGGRGGRVIEVTTLEDNGPGSLRAALLEKGPRIVVFRIGGLIHLKKDLQVNDPFVTIAGQSAPGDGVCLAGAALRINTHDVVVRFLRVRVGDDPAGPDPENRDAIGIASRNAPPHHVVLDHCSVSWAIDENLQLWYPCHDITVQWCLIAESLEKSLHPKGRHGMGLLVGDHAKNISIHHSLFAHNMDRNPLLKGDTTTEVINNIIYNWRSHGTAITDLEGSGPSRADVIANLYLPGPQTSKRASGITLLKTLKPETAVYVRDNIGPGRDENSGGDWSLVRNDSTVSLRADHRVFSGDRAKIESVETLREHVLGSVGATFPVRDAADGRVVQSVRDGTGSLINSQSDVGGWPTYRGATPPTDADHDGIPDDWETKHGLNPKETADGARVAPSGYTWVEEYLNSLVH